MACPTYFLAVLKPPKNFPTWHGQNKKKTSLNWRSRDHWGKCKVNWPIVCSPSKYEGLEVLDLDKFARALRM